MYKKKEWSNKYYKNWCDQNGWWMILTNDNNVNIYTSKKLV